MNNLQGACDLLGLGEMIESPVEIPGGLLHKIYAVTTKVGKYAIKALNPKIMLRPEARQNFINSEKIARIVRLNQLPALAAMDVQGTSIQMVDQQFFLVYDWIDGRMLTPAELNPRQCRKIGAILAEIHNLDFSESGITDHVANTFTVTNWRSYLHEGLRTKSIWVDLFADHIDLLYGIIQQVNQASLSLATERVISHGDLEPKNVMWVDEDPIIIDWESAGYIHPAQDLVETAIYWSVTEANGIDKQRFMAFVNGYRRIRGKSKANWKAALMSGFLGKLGWLEYNLRRSLNMEASDEQEQQLGSRQVIHTLHDIKRYLDSLPEIERWLREDLADERRPNNDYKN